MQTIINEFNRALACEDLFSAWQDEVRLRNKIRTASLVGEQVQIESPEEFNFLKRSLYYGNKQAEFFMILFRNMQNSSILQCILNSTTEFKSDFFHYLISFILDEKPHPNDLLFLINMYQEELQPFYTEVIGALDYELCSYLLPRTTNQSLRKLIKTRQIQLTERGRESSHGHTRTPRSTNTYPTLFGDKIHIIIKAIKSLKIDQSDPVGSLLEGAEMLCRAGLLTDCLAILAEMVKYNENSNVYALSGEEPYHQQISKLLRKSLPIYTLLVYSTEPHRYALDLYRSLFIGFNSDPASLLYLDIYTIVSSGLHEHRPYTRYELAQKAARILRYRPDDIAAQLLQCPGEKVDSADIAELVRAIVQRQESMPHESLVIMELLRLLQQEGSINLDQEIATALFKQYINFFNWIPGPFFINEHILKQLGPLIDEPVRNIGKQIVSVIQAYTQEGVSVLDSSHEGKYFQENNHLTKQLLLSQVMGVF